MQDVQRKEKMQESKWTGTVKNEVNGVVPVHMRSLGPAATTPYKGFTEM